MPQTSNNTPRQPGYCRNGDRAYTRINGVWFNLGPYGTPESKAAYDQLIATWLANGRRLVKEAATEPAKITVAQVVLGYYQHAEVKYGRRHNAKKTLSHVKLGLKTLNELFGDLPAEKFGPKALQTVREAFVAQGLARSTVNSRVWIVRNAFSWAVREELVPPSLVHGLQEVKGLQPYESSAPEPRKIRPVPDAHVDALKPHVSRQVWAMIELQRLTGMRSGEVLIMRGRDLDMTGDLWVYRPARHKTQHRGFEREILIGKQGQEVLRPFLRRNLEEFLFRPDEAAAERQAKRSKERATPPWPSHLQRNKNKRKLNPRRAPKKVYTVNSYRRAIEYGCRKACPVPKELKDDAQAVARWHEEHRWHPHQLRHSAATRIRSQFGLEAARIVLGHAHVATTEIYGERDRSVAAQVMAKIG